MSRQIKFRVWDGSNNIMIYPGRKEEEDEYWFRLVWGESTGWWMEFLDCYGAQKWEACCNFVEGATSILMQFTGLHDKNGKEIWEGDIIRILDVATDGSNYYENFVVEWDQKYASFEAEKNNNNFPYFSEELQDKGNPIEVIGNIWENPELIGDSE